MIIELATLSTIVAIYWVSMMLPQLLPILPTGPGTFRPASMHATKARSIIIFRVSRNLTRVSCCNTKHIDLTDCYLSFPLARPWYYQTCNEYGWYQSSRSNNQPFGSKFPATLYIELCKDVFASKYGSSQIEANVAQTNIDFGGMEPNVENVYMTHGELDPWNPIGHGVAEGATVITDASHCSDFSSVNTSSNLEMRNSKLRIAELVREWLA